jgi:Ni/Fe-hydrogenase subunit HybB-like protein
LHLGFRDAIEGQALRSPQSLYKEVRLGFWDALVALGFLAFSFGWVAGYFWLVMNSVLNTEGTVVALVLVIMPAYSAFKRATQAAGLRKLDD